MTKRDRINLEEIEDRLKDYTYEEIPQKFINTIEDKFSMFGYLKSLLEFKKEKSRL